MAPVTCKCLRTSCQIRPARRSSMRSARFANWSRLERALPVTGAATWWAHAPKGAINLCSHRVHFWHVNDAVADPITATAPGPEPPACPTLWRDRC
jgi:hypothetical protein